MKFDSIFSLIPVNRTAKQVVSQTNSNDDFLLSAMERHKVLVQQLRELESNLTVWRKTDRLRYKKSTPKLEELKKDISIIKQEIKNYKVPENYFIAAATRLLSEHQLEKIYELARKICEQNKG